MTGLSMQVLLRTGEVGATAKGSTVSASTTNGESVFAGRTVMPLMLKLWTITEVIYGREAQTP